MSKRSTIISKWLKRKRGDLLKAASSLSVVGLGWLVLSHAWFTDDAYFSFRSVDNFVKGYGLTWNVTERVQAYTHPLWVLLLSVFYFFTHEIYLTTIFISLVLTIGVAVVILKFTQNKWQAVSAIFLLALSTAFIDYSTSGLENPLSHLLIAAFLIVFLRKERSDRKLLWMVLLAALAGVNRLDTILFCAPALTYEFWQQGDKWRALGILALGFLPLAAWEIFSVVYYGFPFPNTYYAKAQNYVALGEEIWAGLNYFLFTLKFDPITWVIIATAFATTVWRRQKQAIAVMLGVLLYLAYILQIGGDFMGGRFLSVAYLVSVFTLLIFLFPKLQFKKHWALIPVLIIVSLLASSPPYFLYAKGFNIARWNGVVDERMVYSGTHFMRTDALRAFNSDSSHTWFNDTAFFFKSVVRGSLFRLEAENDWIDLGKKLRAQAETQGDLFLSQGANGFTGYYAGPHVYIINGLALTDGLLARVPPMYDPNWRSGHFMRLIPRDYLGVESGTQAGFSDPALDAYFKKIRTVIEGPLFTAERWQDIWELNTKKFDDLLPGHAATFRFPRLQTISLATPPENGVPLALNLQFSGASGTSELKFPQPVHASKLELGLGAGDNFRLVYLDAGGSSLGSQELISQQTAGTETYSVQVPTNIATQGYTALRLEPIRVFYDDADGNYSWDTIVLE